MTKTNEDTPKKRSIVQVANVYAAEIQNLRQQGGNATRNIASRLLEALKEVQGSDGKAKEAAIQATKDEFSKEKEVLQNKIQALRTDNQEKEALIEKLNEHIEEMKGTPGNESGD